KVLVFDALGLRVIDPREGVVEKTHSWVSPMNMNSAQPLPIGFDRVVLSSEKDNGTALLDCSQKTPIVVWQTRRFAARFASMVYWKDHIYGLMDGRLHCLDAKTGNIVWKEGSFGNGQIILADEKLVITNEKGGIHLVAVDPAEFRELGKRPVFDHRQWNMPALAGNQLFIRTHRKMACIELPTATSTAP
ncbi:MAG: hypothetical protein ACRCZF_11800, partial [Gemmataceae bacterium]